LAQLDDLFTYLQDRDIDVIEDEAEEEDAESSEESAELREESDGELREGPDGGEDGGDLIPELLVANALVAPHPSKASQPSLETTSTFDPSYHQADTRLQVPPYRA